jgi:hypothetical protein
MNALHNLGVMLEWIWAYVYLNAPAILFLAAITLVVWNWVRLSYQRFCEMEDMKRRLANLERQ